MTRRIRISLIITVVGSALVLGVPVALGKAQPVTNLSDAVERAVLAREHASRIDATVYRDAAERAVLAQGRVGEYSDAFQRALVTQARAGSHDRSVGLNRQYGLGEFTPMPNDAFERAVVASERGSAADRSIGLNRLYGLGEFAAVPMSDTHDRLAPVQTPTSPPSVGVGRDLDWPQLGIGFGIGLLLATALILAVRSTRIRPLAH